MRVFNRLRLPGLLVGALAFALIGCGGGGSDSSDAETLMAVVQEIPTNGQQVAGDLSDVGGVFELQFSTALDEDTILDPSNPFNGLSANLNMLDNTLIRVAGTPEVKGKYFRFIPPASGLPPQQYTVTVTTEVKTLGGQALAHYFYSAFTVGEDNYEPIIRRTSPVQNQSMVARDHEIVITFNESLDPGSVNTQTVLVQDGGQNPPVTIAGVLSLENNGFEIHFTPDPATQMPPDTTVVVTLQGGNGGIADATNGKPFLDTAGTQTYVLQFNTTPGGDPLNQFARGSVYFVDGKSFGVIDIGTYTGIPAMPGSNGRQVLANSRRKVGSPGEMIIDPRVSGNGDTFAYVVDLNSSTIAVLNTFNSRIVGRINAKAPRGLGTSGGRLYVSQFGTDTLAVYNTALASPGTNNWNDSQDQLTGSAVLQSEVSVGRGPLGVARAPDQGTVFVCNSLEGTCSIMNVTNSTIAATWQTGGNPQDVGITLTFPGLGYFALVSNLGSSAGDPGSASLWWSANPAVQHWLIAGLQNPRGVIYDFGINWYVANSGGSSVSTVILGVQGNTIVPSMGNTFHTGKAPQNVSLDPVSLAVGFSSDRGDGIVTVFAPGDTTVVLPYIEVDAVRWIATLVNQ